MVTLHQGRTAPEEARAAGRSPLDYLRDRGFVQDISNEAGLRLAFADGVVTAYVGFDPTARSLHAGHMLGIMALGVLQRFGHRPISLGGGGTVLVGDPTGRTSTRPTLTEDEIRANLVPILGQLQRYLDFEGNRFGVNPPALLVNNADWLLGLSYIPFLRDIGRHFSVNEMLAAETYRTRLEAGGLNFVEFNYRIVQAYDFLHLFRETGCILQMGGSDQWGNITAGVELIRKADAGQAFALVWPLLTTASGQKMGKSAGNSLWLDPELTSPFEFYQYWVNVEDADVERLLKLYTFLPDDRIAELTSVSGAALREAKQTLALEITALTHGPEAAEQAAAGARALFAGTTDLEDPNIPTTDIALAEMNDGLTVAEVFVRAGLVSSRGDARRLASQGGLSIGETRVEDVDLPWPIERTTAMIRSGKRRRHRVRIV